MQRRSRLWLLPVLLAVLVAGGYYFGFRARNADRELPVYVRGAARLVAGEEIYRRGTDDKPFTYPPFAALPFVPFTWLPPEWQPPAWFAVNFAVLLAVLAAAGRWLQVRGEGPHRGGWIWLLVLLVAGRHLFSVFENQSHDMLMLGIAMLVALAWCRGGAIGTAAAGAWAGIGAAFKATPLLFGGMFLLRRSWLGAAALVLSATLATLLPDVLFPRQDGRSWAVAWYEVNLRGLEVGGTAAAAGAWNSHSVLNQSLSGTLTRLLVPAPAPGPFVREDVLLFAAPPWFVRAAIHVCQLLVLAAIGLGVVRARRAVTASADPVSEQRRLGLGECGLVALGMVLLSPQSSKSHFCVLLLPALFCAERMLRGRRDVMLWALFLAAALLGALTAKDVLGRDAGNVALGVGAVAWSALLLLFATVRALHQPAAGQMACNNDTTSAR